MNSAARKIPTGRKQPSVTERLRRRIFCLCAELGLDDDARRAAAGSCRTDGRETMRGMAAGELHALEQALLRQKLLRQGNSRTVSEAQRQSRLRQHKRVDGNTGRYASERARYFLRGLAQAYWGADWERRLNLFLYRQTNTLLTWDAPHLTRQDVYQVTEGVKAMLGRKS